MTIIKQYEIITLIDISPIVLVLDKVICLEHFTNLSVDYHTYLTLKDVQLSGRRDESFLLLLCVHLLHSEQCLSYRPLHTCTHLQVSRNMLLFPNKSWKLLSASLSIEINAYSLTPKVFIAIEKK